jgi:hypothetical protein
MEAAKLYAIAAFVAGLIITLFLAAYLTPRDWWRRPNARALFIMVAGAWGFGSLILYATHAPAWATTGAAVAATVAPQTAMTRVIASGAESAAGEDRGPAADQPFHVHRALNLRAAPGVHAARVAIVPAGAEVRPTGARQGDWWQIKATVNGNASTGWASSLWLRRSGE